MPSTTFARSAASLDRGPSAAWLAAGFLLAGLGTALLGPILPFVSAAWHLTDAQAGTLFLTKFLGACVGGLCILPRLRVSIFTGTLACTAGFAAFALASSLGAGAAALFVAGFGIGQIIASSNILAGQRYSGHTGSALAALNFFFAFGLVTTGLLAAAFVPHFGVRVPVLVFASLFLVCGIGGWLSRLAAPLAPAAVSAEEHKPLPLATFLLFALLLIIYGGLETSLVSWLPTFTLRFADHPLLRGQSAFVLFLASLTAGRALASLAMRRVRESTLQAAGLAVSVALLIALLRSHSAAAMSIECILLGLALAPFFPATFAVLMHRRPSPRTAAVILAVSGIGAAFFPWLMGRISTSSGSLRTAMYVPAALALALLVLGSLRAASDRPIEP